jgi:hypothetical protein
MFTYIVFPIHYNSSFPVESSELIGVFAYLQHIAISFIYKYIQLFVFRFLFILLFKNGSKIYEPKLGSVYRPFKREKTEYLDSGLGPSISFS